MSSNSAKWTEIGSAALARVHGGSQVVVDTVTELQNATWGAGAVASGGFIPMIGAGMTTGTGDENTCEAAGGEESDDGTCAYAGSSDE